MDVTGEIKLRLDKYLSEMGLGSRSEVKEAIRKGHVRINGEVKKRPEVKIGSEDIVHFKGNPVNYVEYEYIMLNKPAGVVSATEDRRDKTVIDLVNCRRKDLFPVGRLDKDTEGLLLLTNDGELAHRLLSPKHHVPKVYYARVSGRMDGDDILKFKEGLDLGEDFKTLPAELEILKVHEDETTEIQLKIYEGKFHQVKRMVHAVGKEVVYLKRLSMGSLVLDEKLLPGEYRPLTESEREALYDRKF